MCLFFLKVLLAIQPYKFETHTLIEQWNTILADVSGASDTTCVYLFYPFENA